MEPRNAVIMLAVALALAVPERATGAEPLRAQVSRCVPLGETVTGAPDSNDNGFGNTPGQRWVRLDFAYAVRSVADDGHKADAIAATRRVHVCRSRAGEADVCPGGGSNPDAAWIIWDADLDLGTAPVVGRVKSFGANGAAESFTLPAGSDGGPDWGDGSQAGTFLYLRVEGQGRPLPPREPDSTARDLGGWCPVAEPLVVGSQFAVYGVPAPGADPWGGAHGDVCTDGSKTGVYGAGLPGACVDAAVGAQFVHDYLLQIDSWQRRRLLGPLAGALVPPGAHWNGQRVECGPTGGSQRADCPYRVRLYPDSGGKGGFGTLSLPTSNVYSYTRQITTGGACGPIVRPRELSDGAGKLLRLMAHESFHTLQRAWDLRVEDSPVSWAMAFKEQAPPAIETNFCLFNYPGLALDQCASPRKLGFTGNGIRGFENALGTPEKNPLSDNYVGVIFWRYVIEQFATRAGPANPAHPVGPDSAIPLPPNPPPLGDRARHSDEGADLLGLALDQFRKTPRASSYDAIDALLSDRSRTPVGPLESVNALGRGLDAVALDLHTAYVLKDYRDTDPRWRFDWLGNYNAGRGAELDPCALNPVPPAELSTYKPFPVPRDLRGTPGNRLDGVQRVHRLLDSHVACDSTSTPATCPSAPPVTLPAGASVAYSRVATLDSFGAAYLSVRPAPTPGSTYELRVLLTAALGSVPRFRIFTVDPSGVPSLIQGCDVDPDGGDPAQTESCALDASGVVDRLITIPPTGEVAEVIVVASAGRDPAHFKWAFGPTLARIGILDPTSSTPAQLGHPAAANGTRPFLLQFAAWHDNDEPRTGIRTDEVTIRLPHCALADCTLPPTAYEVVEVGAGFYWALVSVPDAFYPPPPAQLDLELEVAATPAPDLETLALTISDLPPTVVAELVVDKSGSMAAPGKLSGAKVAAQLVVDSLQDGDELGLVTFHNDAQTPIELLPLTMQHRDAARDAIAGLTAGGWTSLGDGLLEAQSNLASRHDDPSPDFTHVMVVLSDGINNRSWAPRDYYQNTSAQDLPEFNTDGVDPSDPDPTDNGEWPSWPLSIPDRQKPCTGCPPKSLPTLSVIAFGQDADLLELQKLATAGRTLRYVPDPASPAFSAKAALDLSNRFRESVSSASGHERTATTRAYGLDLALMSGIEVEAGATELLVSVASAPPAEGVPAEDPQALALISPSGYVFLPVQAGPTTAVFRVQLPERGVWSWQNPAAVPASNLEPVVFVETAIRSPVELLVHAGPVSGVRLPPGVGSGGENGHFTGADVVVRALATDGSPITGVSLTATVTLPDGTIAVYSLRDDGRSADGGPDDGIYGAVVRHTSQVGAYDVQLTATGTSTRTGGTFRRERSVAFELHDGADGDGDGLPDWWEEQWGTDPAVPDAASDPDADGLSNAEEFLLHTAPYQSDSDFGGESDASEIAAGRDPRDPIDDVVRPFVPEICPGNRKVLVIPEVPIAAGVKVEVIRLTPTGPVVVFHGPLPAAGAIPVPAQNGERQCYQARVTGDGVDGGFSPTVCATPAEDPNPPQVEVSPPGGEPVSSSRTVTLNLDATDRLEDLLRRCSVTDPSVVDSGLAGMIVSDRSDFAGAAWVPFSFTAQAQLQDAPRTELFVKVRDAAGNESEPASIVMNLVVEPLSCPGPTIAQATYDPGTNLLPEQSTPAWTNVSTGESIVGFGELNGAPVLRIIDARIPIPPASVCEPSPLDQGTTYTLALPALATATSYGIEARVAVPTECADPGGSGGEAAIGVVDGERTAAVVITGPGRHELAFVDPRTPSGWQTPVVIPDTASLHTYSLRCVRGVTCDVFVDRGAAPVLSIPWETLPPTDPALPFVSGAFAIHTARSITDWARLDVLACGADPLPSAKSTVEATAAQIALLLPAARATQVNHHLTGGGGATVKLDEAQAFLDAGRVCPAAGKIGAAGAKVDAARNQLSGFPVCPGGARCVTSSARDQSLALLSLARLRVAEAEAWVCAGDLRCGSCQGP